MLSRDLERYIDGRRSLGFKLRSQSVQLRSFVAFAEQHGDRYIKSARVLAWASQAPSPEHRRNRLLMARRFALAMRAENALHQVPEAEALGRVTTKRRSPYIYAPDEIARLLGAAAALEPAASFRPIMYTTLIGLIAATGLRIAEALALHIDDVTADGLVIRETKFQKSRLLPLHETVQQELDKYMTARRGVLGDGGLGDSVLFVSGAGRPLPYNSVRYVFLTLLDRTGLRGTHAGRDPRIHDLRHTFAVRSLEQCGHDRMAVARHIVALSTYLGHAHVTDTYWYLQATPVLMGQIAEAGEALLAGGAA
jgi:integrase